MPDLRLSVLPKFTLENRLPIPVEFRLYGKRQHRPAAADGTAAATADGAAPPTGADAVEPSAALPPRVERGWEPADDESRQDLRDELAVYLASKLAAAREEMAGALSTGVEEDVQAAPAGPAVEQALPIGTHTELLSEFLHDSALWLQLRYREDEPLDAPTPAPPDAAPAAAARRAVHWADAATSAGDAARANAPERAAGVGGAEAAAAAAAAAEVPWGKREPLRIAEFEANRQISIDEMQELKAGRRLKLRRDYLRFDLNRDMQAGQLADHAAHPVGGAPSASLDHVYVLAAPTQPGAPPEQLARWPCPPQPGCGQLRS